MDVDTGADLGPCANLAALTHGQHASTGGCEQRRARGRARPGRDQGVIEKLSSGSPASFQREGPVLTRAAHTSKSAVRLLAC